MDDVKGNSTGFGTLLVTNVLVAVLTAVGIIIAQDKVFQNDPKFFIWLCYLIVAAGTVFLASMHLRIAYNDLAASRRRAEHLEAIPSFVVMENRRDHFQIHDSGSAKIKSSFDLSTDVDGVLREIMFPIFAERPTATNNSPVKVERVVVDGRDEMPAESYFPLQVRHLFKSKAGSLPVEYGVLKVPVQLQRGMHSHVEFELTLDAFHNRFVKEFAIVDIPYITKALEVVIECPDGYMVRPCEPVDETIVATSSIVENKDPSETASQRHEWRTSGRSLVWTTEHPKLGYRYKVYFHLTKTATS
jgi:hypothetical protein